MDLGKLLGAVDLDEVREVVDLVLQNKDLLGRLRELPELFASFADGLDSAADQARSAGVVLVGSDGDAGVRGTLGDAATSLVGIAPSLGQGVSLVGDAAEGIGKLPLLDTPARHLASAVDQLSEATGNLTDLAGSMTTIAELLETVGAALGRLGDHLAESGGQARGFLGS